MDQTSSRISESRVKSSASAHGRPRPCAGTEKPVREQLQQHGTDAVRGGAQHVRTRSVDLASDQIAPRSGAASPPTTPLWQRVDAVQFAREPNLWCQRRWGAFQRRARRACFTLSFGGRLRWLCRSFVHWYDRVHCADADDSQCATQWTAAHGSVEIQ